MSRVWIEGFEVDKTVTDLNRKYASVTLAALTVSSGPKSSTCLENTAAGGILRTPVLSALTDTWIVGERINVTSATVDQETVLDWRDSNSFSGSQLVLFVRRPSAGDTTHHYFGIQQGPDTLLTSAKFPNGEWHYHEILAKIHPTEGRIEWRIDGSLVLFVENVNTAKLGTSGADRIHIHSSNFKIDDIYINNSLGDYNNSFDGEQIIEGIQLVADASPNDWNPASAGDHFEEVDEDTSDDDTSYLSNIALDAEESFDIQMPSQAFKSIDAIVVSAVGRLEDPEPFESRDIDLVADGLTSTKTFNSTSYDHVQEIFPRDLDGNPWTTESLQALKIGMKT